MAKAVSGATVNAGWVRREDLGRDEKQHYSARVVGNIDCSLQSVSGVSREQLCDCGPFYSRTREYAGFRRFQILNYSAQINRLDRRFYLISAIQTLNP